MPQLAIPCLQSVTSECVCLSASAMQKSHKKHHRQINCKLRALRGMPGQQCTGCVGLYMLYKRYKEIHHTLLFIQTWLIFLYRFTVVNSSWLS